MIKVKGISKSFRTFKAVDNLSFEVSKGDVLGLLGPNGAGKSTTINMLSGIFKKDSGEIRILDKDIEKDLKSIQKEIGIVPQDIAIFYDLTTRENLMYFGSLYGLKGKNLKSRVDEVLKFISLQDVSDKLPSKFSGGMKRRLNIGCSIVHNPKIIILDEPTVGIDAQSRNHILEGIKELNKRGTTVIYTSHYMEEIEAICNKIVIIDNGKVIESGYKDELLNKYNELERLQIVVSENDDNTLVNNISKINGVVSCKENGKEIDIILKDKNTLEKIIREVSIRNISLVSINIKKKNLEDIFLELTGKSLRE